MIKAYAVIGANYGDEGKGLMVDYLTRIKGSPQETTVVRFNGGAQAGHTVQLPDGTRHVFHHFGAGSLAGAGTALSQFFICNPALFRTESELLQMPHLPVLAHYNCPITTPYDMIVNQARERSLGLSRHGSCGVGIFDTIQRHRTPELRLTVGELSTMPERFFKKVATVRKYLMHEHPAFADELAAFTSAQQARWVQDCEYFIERVLPFMSMHALASDIVIFEGAQGLALDQNNMDDYPHLTPSNTGLENVSILAKQYGIDMINAVYVTRTYLTRHGNGPLKHGMPMPEEYVDKTNVPNEFQGSLRFAPLEPAVVMQRIANDVAKAQLPVDVAVAMTCADHLPPPEDGILNPRYISRGPTYEDVEED